MPGSTTDLAIPYASPSDSRAGWPGTNQTMSERIEALLKGVQFSTGDGLIGDGAPGTPLKTALSGIWGQNLDGNAPLDVYGPIAQTITTYGAAGQAIYLDANGELRAPPLAVSGPAVNRLNADPVAVYPLGPSVTGIDTALAASGGWPLGFSAIVLTNKRDVDNANQLWFQNTRTDANIKIKYRSGDLNGWTSWVDLYPHFSGRAVCNATTTLVATTLTDIPGMTLTVPVTNPTAVYLVTCTYDVGALLVNAAAFLGQLSVGGVVQSSQAVWVPTTSGGANGRVLLSQTHLVKDLPVGDQVFKGQMQCSTASTFKISSSHTAVTVTQIS